MTMPYFLRRRSFLGLFIAAMMGFALPAHHAMADELDDAKAAGIVGETEDGFLKARDPKGQAIVDKINAQRRKYYEDIAKKNGVSVEAVGRLTAQELFEKAPKGTYLLVNGQWVKK